MAFINRLKKGSYYIVASLLLFSCTRISTSELGLGLLPSLDAINTQDTILDVETETVVMEDSVRIYPTDENVIGNITNDPIFGTTNAAAYFQLKPSFFPFYISGVENELIVDSAVLILSYRGYYGDSSKPVTIYVNKIDPSTPLEVNKFYASNYQDFYGIKKGQSIANPHLLNFINAQDSVNNRFEKAKNQVRIKLNISVAKQLLLNFDSTNAYKNDTTFRNAFSGFAVYTNAADNQNALVRFSLLDSNTKLGLYYSRITTGSTVRDTAVTYFRFNYYTAQGANFIQRNRTGAEIASHLKANTKDSLVYVQTSPGTMVKIKIPGLKTFKNKLIHRAELIAEQVPDDARLTTTDSYMTAPNYLFLAAYDSVTKELRNVPNDYQGSTNAQLLKQFGGQKMIKSLHGYNNVATYNFNVSRYVQGLIARTDSLFDFRLFAPVNDSIKFVQPYPYNKIITTDYLTTALGNQAANGRVRLGGGSHSKFKMRLRIYYTDL